MKKFYKLVTAEKTPDGFTINLDGRPVKTPLKQTLLASTEAVANEIVKEWAAQEETIKPDSMPLTQILSTQLDRVGAERPAMEAAIFKYLDTDLICYRAGDDPPGQAKAQEKAWNPWLEWFEGKYGAALQTTTSLAALTQDAAAHNAVQDEIKAMDDARFTVLQLATSLSGSLVLGLAFTHQGITPEEIYNAARVEEQFKGEIYNEEFYGMDPLQEKKDAAMKTDLDAARLYLSLL